MLIKAAKGRIPVIVSRSAPTDLAVELAVQLGITVIGFARGQRMNIYSNTERIKF
jgi:FdhD protein